MNRRDEFIERMKAQLDEWNAEIEALAERARQASAEAQVRYQDDIERLRRRRDETWRRLEELQYASEAAWDTLQQGLDDAWELLRKALRDAQRREPPPQDINDPDDTQQPRSPGGSP
ncbi:MAG: hypothetical protein LPK20_06930 [Halomonas sp.]|uniref:Uncharacterized protein n=1 Tax=Billgrantia tianxiuensis TaxID=2497861 RepID=A0A6I6SS17_9GAMM|nr:MULTISPECIES: hypothetical protein [Halomonas]MCE8035951.1 hypothetical protein [Halomonas sp. MCCC 1A11057]MDX5433286.1 hypothetical protein [Halomonas sp.]QHC51556.1 hypothetical protein EKK97_20835 [Halomonas tianxiuensis]